MPLILDHQLRESIPHNDTEFPITYYYDELALLPNWAGPLHWHTDFEIATATKGVLDYQVGQEHIVLEEGDSIFVNVNVLHSIKQLSGELPDPMPNIVFSDALIASKTSVIYKKYIQPIAKCDTLPFVVFKKADKSCGEVRLLIRDIYELMNEKKPYYELAVQRNISRIFEFLSCHFEGLPKSNATRIQISNQVRLQKMLMYIYENYAEPITLADIAKSADISRSEAGRCFNAYMNSSPISVLIQYRLQMAQKLLNLNTQTIQEICYACGFNSVNYFRRQFKKQYGYCPSQVLGK